MPKKAFRKLNIESQQFYFPNNFRQSQFLSQQSPQSSSKTSLAAVRLQMDTKRKHKDRRNMWKGGHNGSQLSGKWESFRVISLWRLERQSRGRIEAPDATIPVLNYGFFGWWELLTQHAQRRLYLDVSFNLSQNFAYQPRQLLCSSPINTAGNQQKLQFHSFMSAMKSVVVASLFILVIDGEWTLWFITRNRFN